MITLVCFRWGDPASGAPYASAHVNALASMLRRQLREPFRLLCITDNPRGLDETVEPVEMPEVCRQLIRETSGNYAKLWLFSRDFADLVNGQRFIYLDLDVVVTGDLSTLYHRDLPLAIGDGMRVRRGFAALKHRIRRGYWPRRCPVNSTILMAQPGFANDLWDDFDPSTSPHEPARAEIRGTDQAWIYLRARDRLTRLTRDDGIYRAAWLPKHQPTLPENCRLVAFPGGDQKKPWSQPMRQRYPWIADYYPLDLLETAR